MIGGSGNAADILWTIYGYKSQPELPKRTGGLQHTALICHRTLRFGFFSTALSRSRVVCPYRTECRNGDFHSILRGYFGLHVWRGSSLRFSGLNCFNRTHSPFQVFFFFDHRASAAFLAISRRRSGVKFSLRFLPPRLPRRFAYSFNSSCAITAALVFFFLFATSNSLGNELGKCQSVA